MYLDNSRKATLARLDKQLLDMGIDTPTKRRIWKARDRILKTARDKKLAEMRERLTKATFDNNKYEMWKITCQIKDYMGEEIPVDIYEGKV